MRRMLVPGLMTSAALLLLLLARQLSPFSDPLRYEAPEELGPTDGGYSEPVIKPVPKQLLPSIRPVLAEAGEETDNDKRESLLERAAESVEDAEVPILLEQLIWELGEDADTLRGSLLRRWAEQHPEDAARWVTGLTEGDARCDSAVQVALAWSPRDFSAALDWVKALSEGRSKEAALLSLAYESCRTDPLQALELASPLPDTHERHELITHAVSQWAAADPQSAAKWTETITDSEVRALLLGAVATTWANQDPKAAAALTETLIPPGDARNRTAVAVALRWAQYSPDESRNWLDRFLPNLRKDTSLHDQEGD